MDLVHGLILGSLGIILNIIGFGVALYLSEKNGNIISVKKIANKTENIVDSTTNLGLSPTKTDFNDISINFFYYFFFISLV